jgi:YihY family inner membrane protein
MPDLRRAVRGVDRLQRRHRPAAFSFAVVKKFGDDQGGNLAALITYYGFVSLFPLLLVGATVLGYLLQGNDELQHRVVDSALANFPIIGDQIQANIGTVRGSGVALVLGILLTLYGGLGIANVAQQAMNRIWAVPIYDRPGFVPRTARSMSVLATIGLGVLAATVLNGIGVGLSQGAVARAAIDAVAIIWYIGLFLLAFQVLVAVHVRWRDLLPGAIVAGIAWELSQTLGVLYVSRVLQGMSQVYGFFALVLGLLAWISLEARVVLYAAEINAVRVHRLWPRSLAAPLTDADRRAEILSVRNRARHRDEEIEVELAPPQAGAEDRRRPSTPPEGG